MSLLPFLHRVSARTNLPAAEAEAAMTLILEGQASTVQIGAFLVALHMKGETPEELMGFARAMRSKVARVELAEPLIDTCGTGGGHHTFNISTIAAFVVAGAGVRVAKHGNRSMSTECGSADILEKLGVNIQLPPERVADSIREVGIGFLFAPAFHPAMKHAQPARVELKMRTVFNLVGPLTNPAGAGSQLIGAPSQEAAELMAHALAGLGTNRSFVVHGLEGLDEISTTGPTLVFEVKGHIVEKHLWTPADFGVDRTALAELSGGTRERNLDIAERVLRGERGPHRDIVLVNAAAALVAAGHTKRRIDAMAVAAASIDSGAARAKVDQLAAFTKCDPE